jgi:hypothetical protein
MLNSGIGDRVCSLTAVFNKGYAAKELALNNRLEQLSAMCCESLQLCWHAWHRSHHTLLVVQYMAINNFALLHQEHLIQQTRFSIIDFERNAKRPCM